MKKIIFMLMAAMALFTSCNNDEVLEAPASKQDIKFNFTFEKVDEDGTRALKSAWEEGDIVCIMFADQIKGLLVCKYNKEKDQWTSTTEGELNLSDAAITKQKIKAIWVKGNKMPRVNYIEYKVYLEWNNYIAWEFLTTDDTDYTYDATTRTVSAKLVFAMAKSNYTKITVTGLDKDKEWTLASPSLVFMYELRFYNTKGFDGGFNVQNSARKYNDPITGTNADDGICFLGKGSDKESGNTSFTLVNKTDNVTYTKTFTGNTLSCKKAYKFAGPKSDAELNGWTVKTTE